jgi:hypothetical protein
VIELRLGRWEDVLVEVDLVDAVITDPPYSARTHEGHGAAVNGIGGGHDGVERRDLTYQSWGTAEVDAFVDAWAPRCRGWMICLSDSELLGAYRAAFERHERVGFQPIPIVVPGMTVRLCGDGPSSWAVYANISRPRVLNRWGTTAGAYIGPMGAKERASAAVAGAKPLWAMRALIRDYSKAGNLVVDPCAGGATTLLAAAIEGRKAIGAEVDRKTYSKAMKRIAAGYTPDLFAEVG